jgi:mannose-1-phosphate guanylyltransferase/mannose-6-phosphate isomerase
LVAPSDHVIPDTQAFHDAVRIGLDEVQNGKMVTFGIQPTSAETGYGYLELGKTSCSAAVDLVRFVEKPNKEQAEKMLSKGNYLWNAGVFLFRARDMIEAFKSYAPGLLEPIRMAVDGAQKDLGFVRLAPNSWSQCIDISIDFAIFEKAKNLSVVPFLAGWSDLGGWDAVWAEMEPDLQGVSLSTNAHAIDCENTLLRSESDGQEIVGLGLSDIVAIAMPDAVLVLHKSRSQDVKEAVALLKSKNVPQGVLLPKDHRPWGWFESLAISDRFQVKRICVRPGEALSLQSHNHRSEHWIVVEGTAKVTINDKVRLVTEGESVYVPLGAVHRLENPGKLPMLMIEVQTGAYLKEDDIIRHSDNYSRK